MRRRHVQHLLCGYIDGALSAATNRYVEAHLAACGECARELARWRAVLRLVSRHGPMSCPIDCAETVLRVIEAGQGERLIGGASEPPLDACGSAGRSVRRHLLLSPSPLSRAAMAMAAMAMAGGAFIHWRPGLHGSSHPARWAAAAGRSSELVGTASAARHDRWAVSAMLDSTRHPVRAHGPDRLEEAFSRSDSLILAADFVEDDR